MLNVRRWVYSYFDPGRAYMVRTSLPPGVKRPRGSRPWRRAVQESGYGPIGADGRVERPSPEVAAVLRAQLTAEMQAQQETHEREWPGRMRHVETRYGDLVRATAADLVARGTATITSSEGRIDARVLWFRRDSAVLEIECSGVSKSQSQMTHASARDMTSLANRVLVFLAQRPPSAEPFIVGS